MRYLILALALTACSDGRTDSREIALNHDGAAKLMQTCKEVCKIGVDAVDVTGSQVHCTCTQPLKGSTRDVSGMNCVRFDGSIGKFDKYGDCR